MDCSPPVCRWLLEEAVDVSAPQAVVGDTYARGRNRIPLIVRPDGSFKGQADFYWSETATSPDCNATGLLHQAVQLRATLVENRLQVVLSRVDREFHATRRCPGSKGLQLIELPSGNVPLALPARAGSSVDVPLPSPLHGLHRYLLLDPSANND